MKNKFISLLLFFYIWEISSSCTKKEKPPGECCGKVTFAIAITNGGPTKITECGDVQPVEFCFRIENPVLRALDRSCKPELKDVSYLVNYGDGATDVIDGNEGFCHSFPPGTHIVEVTSIPEMETCSYPPPFTGKAQLAVRECLYPVIKNIINSCCTGSTYCESTIGRWCDISVDATDPNGEPLTYCWDENGDGEFEICGEQSIKVGCTKVERKEIKAWVKNACGCSREAATFIFDCYTQPTPLNAGNISVKFGVSDLYPREGADALFLYLSTSASAPNAPYLMVYTSPLTEPWNLRLVDVHHGGITGGEIAFSSNNYLHMNSPGKGVYVFSATFPAVLTLVSAPPQGGWKSEEGASFKPSQIFVEGITGFLVEDYTAYSVDISDPLYVHQTGRLLSISGCNRPIGLVSSLLPFAFVGSKDISNHSCGIAMYEFKNGSFGAPPLLVLTKEECSGSDPCDIKGLSGSKELVVENEYPQIITYPDGNTAVLELSLFTKGITEEIRLFASDGSSVEEVTSADYSFADKKRIIISDTFYSTHPSPQWAYAITYPFPSLLFAGIDQGEGGIVKMWDAGSYPSTVSSSESPASYKISSIHAFSGGIVTACSPNKPAYPHDQVFFEVFDFSDPAAGRRVSSLELGDKIHECYRLRGFEINGRKTAFVITGAELGVIDIPKPDSPELKKIIYYMPSSLMDVEEYLERYLIFSIDRGGILIYDISDITSPYFISSYENGRTFDGSTLVGNTLYSITNEYTNYRTLEKGNGRVDVINLSDISFPLSLTSFQLSNGNGALTCIISEPAENRLYTGGTNYLGVIDISDPLHPEEIWHSSITTPISCTYENGTLVVLCYNAEFHIFKKVPEGLEYLRRFFPVTGGSPKSVILKNNFLYIGSRAYLTIYDFYDPQMPVLLSHTYLGDIYYQVYDMSIVNNFLFLAVTYEYGPLRPGYGFVYEVSDPTNPVKYTKFSTPPQTERVLARDGGDGSYYIYFGSRASNTINLYKVVLSF